MLVLASLLAVAAQTGTQDEIELLKPKARQGFYLGLGLRSGFLSVNADPVGSLGVFFPGGSFNFRFGQMVNNLLGFGLTIEAGGGSNADWSGGYGGLLVETQLTPIDSIDLAIRGGVGIAGLGLSRVDSELEQEDDPSGNYGSIYALGVSYDWFPFYDEGDSGGFAVSVFVEGRLFPTSSVTAGGVFMGAEISYFFGFGKNRLDLSIEDAYQK